MADEFVKLKATEQVIVLLRPSSGYDVQLEASLTVLNILTENVEAVSLCRESHLNVRSILQEIIKTAGGRAECQVSSFHCRHSRQI